jgi:hypothetical protein
MEELETALDKLEAFLLQHEKKESQHDALKN